MTSQIDHIESHFNKMEDHELLKKIASGILTEEAKTVALAELATRGLTAVSSDEIIAVDIPKKNAFVRAFNGELELNNAFFGSAVIVVVAASPFGFFDGYRTIMYSVYVAVFTLCAYCVWKCSGNTDNRFFGQLANRISLLAMISGVLNMLMLITGMRL
jgi:hypothetical protein